MTNRKSTVWFWLAAIVLVFAACGGDDDNGGNVPPPAATYSISGTVLDNAAGVSGVLVTLTGADNAVTTDTTGADGRYSFTGLDNGTYTITPTKAGVSFEPSSLERTIAGANFDNVDFAVVQSAGFFISGTVRSGVDGVPGVTVNLSGVGTDNTTTTDANGEYTFTGLANGTYTITPTKAGLFFQTPSIEQVVAGANIDNVDFTATALSGLLYIVDNTGTLASIDLATDNVTVIGDLTERPSDIAVDSAGVLYGINMDNVFTISTDNAQTTTVGAHGLTITTAPAMAFSDNGALFVATNRLYTVDPDNGAFIDNVGNGNFPYRASGGLAFVDNTLFLTSSTSNDPAATDNLVMLNTADGRGTLIGDTENTDIFGLAADGNILYGISGTKIVRIETATGATTVLLDYGPAGLNSGLGAGQGLAIGLPRE